MKTIGILGGMSYESSLHYYDRINRQVNDICGNLTSCRMFLYSVNFEEIRKLMLEGDWEKIGAILSEVAKKLESVGCDYVAIATNTIHKVANIIEDKIGIPLIHIADCVSEKCHEKKVSQVLLLGTRYTMTEDFLKNRLEKNGLTVVVPEDKKEIEEIDRIIFDELCKGIVKKTSKEYYIQVIQELRKKHQIEGVILGCTEIEMLIQKEDLDIPIFDTTQAHIDKLVKCSLEEIE